MNTIDIISDLAAGYKNRYIIDDLQEKYKLSYTTIIETVGNTAAYRKHCNYYAHDPADRRIWDKNQLDRLAEMYNANISYEAMADAFETSMGAINYHIIKMRASGKYALRDKIETGKYRRAVKSC